MNGELKSQVIALLTAATYYVKACCVIFPSESLQRFINGKPILAFWPLIHALAHHGVYAIEEDGQIVNHSALAQITPFKEVNFFWIKNMDSEIEDG